MFTKAETAPTPKELADRLKNAKSLLSEAENEVAAQADAETEAIISGTDPSAAAARTAAGRATVEARSRAVTVLTEALKTAQAAALVESARTCNLAQDQIRRSYLEEERKALAGFAAVLDKLHSRRDELNAKMDGIRRAALVAMGLEPGAPQEMHFQNAYCDNGFAQGIRDIVTAALK